MELESLLIEARPIRRIAEKYTRDYEGRAEFQDHKGNRFSIALSYDSIKTILECADRDCDVAISQLKSASP